MGDKSPDAPENPGHQEGKASADILNEPAPAVKLVLDEETGEWVSRNELRKRLQKRAKKKAKSALAIGPATAKGKATSAGLPTRPKAVDAPIDPDAIFKQGFLADVFEERPVKPVITRFPPEPNGYLHLGHAKAIAIDFGFARFHGGKTIIKWLGFTPSEITYSSDNFQRLYELAQDLIRKGGAYVCHCSESEIKLQRGGKDGKEGPRFRCAHADQDIQMNLDKFKDMHDGKYEPQTAFLRMKQDIESGNPQMWDLVAYRIPKHQKPHLRAPEWKIFPTYDFTHCLCDSFEGITHSLCTTEFILSRESYEWLNKTLGVYEPMQREFGRLNLEGTIMSKRGLKQLVDKNIVRGWDDPRLYTLIAIKRRGIPPGAILAFVNELGVTTNRTFIQIVRFEQTVRRFLERTVPRLMLILDPVPITISDLAEPVYLDIPFSPKDSTFGSHSLEFTKTIYIDRSDFREVDSKDYFRLAPGKAVGLLNAPFPIKAVSYTKDETTGLVTGIQAVSDRDVNPEAYISWVPETSLKVEARIYRSLFKSNDPSAAEGGFLNDINPDSEIIYHNALLESGFNEVKQRAPWPAVLGDSVEVSGSESIRFQAIRVGYFAVDIDSTDEKIILNRIVSLKEDSGKNT
uniref:glutamine--tRNA ligase n=1 Tax=Bionectria ochroleuca TaxID=29856 RepID=A0A0B7KMU0_BIOOC